MITFKKIKPPSLKNEVITFKVSKEDKLWLQELGDGCVTYGIKSVMETIKYLRDEKLIDFPRNLSKLYSFKGRGRPKLPRE